MEPRNILTSGQCPKNWITEVLLFLFDIIQITGLEIENLTMPNSWCLTVQLAGANTKGTLDANFFIRNKQVAKCPTFSNIREVSSTHKLPPGNYVIVPTTFNANEEADFILRIFSERKGDQAT